MGSIRKASVLAAVLLATFGGAARAQDIVNVKVPFPFMVNHKQFPAGEYSVRTDDFGGTVIAIEGIDNHTDAFALSMPADGRDPAGEQPALVFTKYENGYRLSQIWESHTEGKMIPGTATPKSTARAETDGEVFVMILSN